MNTPTPGAASELLPCDFCSEVPVGAEVRCMDEGYYAIECRSAKCREAGRFCGVHADDEMDARIAWNTRTPAPVMEGAQREAVAWQYRVPDENASEWTACSREMAERLRAAKGYAVRELYTAPPPPDRVQTRNPKSSIAQPERVEAEHVSEVQRWKDKLFERYAQQTGTYRDLATIAAEMLVESAAREWRTAEAIANTREIGNG